MKKNFEKYQPVDLEWQTSLSQEEFFQKVKDNSVQTGSSSWNKSFSFICLSSKVAIEIKPADSSLLFSTLYCGFSNFF